jgi:hypothetical protein
MLPKMEQTADASPPGWSQGQRKPSPNLTWTRLALQYIAGRSLLVQGVSGAAKLAELAF